MELREAVKPGFDNLTNFESRASRSEFWWYWAAIASPGHHPVHDIFIVYPLRWGAHRAGRNRARLLSGRAAAARLRTARNVDGAFRRRDLLVYTRDLHRPVFGGLGAGSPGELCGSGHPASRGLGGAVLFGPAKRYRLQPVRSAAGIAGLGPPRKGSRRGTTMRIP